MTLAYKYQRQGLRRIAHFKGRAILADEMGLGKTLQSLKYLIYHREECLPCVIVCPAHLKENWLREIEMHIGMSAEILEGQKPYPITLFRNQGITIINYEILHFWLKHIKRLKPKLLIVDEAQAIKNPQTIRSKTIKKIARTVHHLIFLSGTPLTNRPIELFPLLNMLDPQRWPSKVEFGMRYCRARRIFGHWEYKGACRLPELHHILKTQYMIRRRKRDVLKDLPKITRTVIPMRLTNYEEYTRAEGNFIKWLSAVNRNKSEKAKKAEGISRLGYLRRLVGKLKFNLVTKWLDDFLQESEEKIIVFGHHHIMIEGLKKRYGNLAVQVYGMTPPKKKQLAIDQFQHDRNTRIFIGSEAAITGINLTAASTVAFSEMYWTPAAHDQAESRADRIGQKLPVNSYFLVVQNTVEEDLCRINQNKQRILDEVLDGGTVKNSMDLYAQLINYMKERAK